MESTLTIITPGFGSRLCVFVWQSLKGRSTPIPDRIGNPVMGDE